MRRINALNAGLAVGSVVGLWHVMWSALVAVGWAQVVIDFVFWMHFIKPVLLVQPFNLGTAAVLVAITLTTGFALGYVLAAAWNWLAPREAAKTEAPNARRAF